MKKILLLFVLLICFWCNSKAQDTIKITDKNTNDYFIDASKYLNYSKADSISSIDLLKNNLQFKKISKLKGYSIYHHEYYKNDGQRLDCYGFKNTSGLKFYYLRAIITNETKMDKTFIISKNKSKLYEKSNINNDEVYVELIPKFNRENFFGFLNDTEIVKIIIPAGQTKTIVRYEKTSENLNVQCGFWLINCNQYLKNRWGVNTFNSLITGLLIALLLYNLLVFLSLKRKIYLYYSLYFFAIGFILSDKEIIFGSYAYLFFSFVNDYGPLLVNIGIVFYLLFIRNYIENLTLKAEKHIKVLILAILIISVFDLICIVISENTKLNNIYDPAHYAFLFFILLNVAVIIWSGLFSIYLSFKSFKNGYKPAIYVSVGGLLIMVTILLSLLESMFFNTTIFENSYIFAICVDAFILSLGLTYKVSFLQKEIVEEQTRSINTLEDNVTQRTSELLHQKEIVVHQNREILDSIEYAKRIQATILPPPKVVKKYLEDSFILYIPKDIVAGDFYWMDSVELENKDSEYILFAACDCTGHGVPGALVSVVCSNALNRAVREYNIIQPALILDKVSELVVQDFSKDENEEVQDGMDASLCSLNVKSGILEWSGANNPLWILRIANGKMQSENNFKLETLNFELIEVKPDKQPIGKFENKKPFTNHSIQLQKGDTIYMFTDGYADQFGGNKAKKFSKKAFKELVLSIAYLPLQQQREALYSAHLQWRGNNEQVDDICIIGVRV